MLDHKQLVELSFLDFQSKGIPVPRIGTAIFINEDVNGEIIANLLLDQGYSYFTTPIKSKYRGTWKKMLRNPVVLKDSKVILINEEFKTILYWELPLNETTIRMCECFFTCVDDYSVIESGYTLDEDCVNALKDELENKPENLSIYDTWLWNQKAMFKIYKQFTK